MSRAPGVNSAVVLPPPPEKYDAVDQRELRRLLEEALRRLTQWSTVDSVPANVTALATLPPTPDSLPYFSSGGGMSSSSLTALGRALIAAIDAQAARTTLGLGVLGQRASVAITTGTLTNNTASSSVHSLPAKSAALLSIAADRQCRVRLYATQAARDADVARLATVKGTPGTGLLAEFVFDTAGTIPVSPVATLANDEATPVAQVWYTITNTSGGTSTVAVTLTVLPLEI